MAGGSADGVVAASLPPAEESAAVPRPGLVPADPTPQKPDARVASPDDAIVLRENSAGVASNFAASGREDPEQDVAPPGTKGAETPAAMAAKGGRYRDPADASIAGPAIPAGSDYPSSTCLAPEDAAAIQSKLELLIRQEASSKPDSPANSAATPTAAAGRMASPSMLGRRRLWRTLAFGVLLVGSLAIAATAYTRAGARERCLDGPRARSTDAEAAIGRLQRTADSAQPPVDRLQQEAAGSRAEVARLKAEIAAIAEAQAPLLARLDRQQADFTTRIEALRKTAAGDAQVQRLQTEVATLLQEQAPLVAEMRTQGTDLGQRIDGLLEEAIRDRTELARLKEQVIGISQSLPRTAVAPDPQQKGLIDEVAKLRQEILANRTGLRRLEGEFDTIKRASLQKPPDTELNTSSACPPPVACGRNAAGRGRPPRRREAAHRPTRCPQELSAFHGGGAAKEPTGAGARRY